MDQVNNMLKPASEKRVWVDPKITTLAISETMNLPNIGPDFGGASPDCSRS